MAFQAVPDTCQINIIDAVAGKFDFPRMLFAVR